MSFHEKSALACLISITCVYVPYFVVVFRFPIAALGLFWVATAALVAVLTVFHIANAIAKRSIRTTGAVPPIDELDQKIELNAAKWAGLVLAFVVVSWILVAMYSLPLIGGGELQKVKANGIVVSPSNFAIPVFSAMLALHWLFAGFVFANIAYYAGIVIGYRRVASA